MSSTESSGGGSSNASPRSDGEGSTSITRVSSSSSSDSSKSSSKSSTSSSGSSKSSSEDERKKNPGKKKGVSVQSSDTTSYNMQSSSFKVSGSTERKDSRSTTTKSQLGSESKAQTSLDSELATTEDKSGCREEWAELRNMVSDIRSRMKQCHLPPLDVTVIEKFILRVVEESEGGNSSPAVVSAPQRLRNCGRVRPLRYSLPGGPYVRNTPSRITVTKSLGRVVQFRARSRHADHYNSVYNQLQAAADVCVPGRLSATEGGDGGGSAVGAHGGKMPGGSSHAPLVFVGYDNGNGDKGGDIDMDQDIDVPMLFTPGVMEVICLDNILRRHEQSILITLAAINKRESVMERLRAFLVIAAKDLSIPSAGGYDVGTDGCSNSADGNPASATASSLVLQRCGAPVPLRRYMDVNDASWTSFRAKANKKKWGVQSLKQRWGSGARLRGGYPAVWQRYYKLGVLCLLYQLQQASLEVVEGIRAWRGTLTAPFPFVTKGHNYLLAMAQSMAELANDPVMHFLFPPPTPRKKRPGEPKPKPGISFKFSDPDPASFVLPMCLQYYPLLSNMPHLPVYKQPPNALVGINTPFDFGGADTKGNEEGLRGTIPMPSSYVGALVVHQGRIRPNSSSGGSGSSQTLLDLSYGRRLLKAEQVVHSELRVQLRLIEWELTLCAKGCYPLLLRDVGQTEVVYLRSTKRQEEWYFHLRDKLICLEEGSSAVVRG
ncbi:hypothetical protein, conserved [Trypanosoma brucei gambiense DAL972]|uniref:Uncharacterized protein n=1 Tax=Trypanosoma brucei gambiense (strain MHOM/CI/86/DAL972) TaxID=679716 RepID=C9ZI07_TRYB9|nr:hypothetical protein, conserved [Trypanosoma brucei gambiense DAL972]CBH09124.1 hypothetical protein, conserved [Trypanosoma brucei gambiense DAL972]|eukprot:XP_011771565.1 hypothetical protein, conserved [Trypanosoma brucei gambiense DAL972]